MCRFKSMILLKDRVFIPDYDSHQDMLDELQIEDNRKNAESLFVRVELSPADNDVFSDISTWKYTVDQDILPDWYVEEVDKKRAIEATEKWAKNHIFIGQNNLKLKEGGKYYIKDCKNVIVYGSTTVNAWGSATVKAWGSATVEAWGSATVKAYDSATVFNSQFFGWRNKDTIILCDNATFKDNDTKTIYQAGDWKLVIKEGVE